MVYHKEFEKAGKKPGLQVWRVEKMDLNPVPLELYGNFFTGDCYVVLHTTRAPSFSIFTWCGKEASQDERAAAAIFMVQMDDALGQSPMQFMETQGNESLDFKQHFKSGITYLRGGVASGFNHVVNEEVKRLLHVKGRRCPSATEFDLSWDSFNKDDCFIIELGKNIYHWSGSESNHFERIKATELANDIRDNERHGRSQVLFVMEGEEPEEVIKELGPKPDLPPSSYDDASADRATKAAASLYLISDCTGSMETTLVSDKTPHKQANLRGSDCFLLDNGGDGTIFVWKGKEANADERKEVLKVADKFIRDHNYPQNTRIQIMPAGSETTCFKQFFSNWLDKDETTGLSEAYTIGRIAKVEQIPFDASSLHSNNAMAAQHSMVDDGSGNVQIWRVEGGDKSPVDTDTYGQFFGGDCYLVLYTYRDGGRERHIIYIWQGRKCSKDELGASAILAIAMDDSMGGVATQVRVTQGQEPPHLVSIFKKPMLIHLGGTSREGGQSQSGSTRLFHIRMSSTKALRAVEVEPTASSLNTNDIFVLMTSDATFLWIGKGACDEEEKAVEHVTSMLGVNPIGDDNRIDEGSEPDTFWTALGGKGEYQTSLSLQRARMPPRLFGCSNKTGRLVADEVPGDFTQLDLAPDDVMILDIWEQIFVWVGKEANETEKAGASNIAEEYLRSDPAGRGSIPMSTIKQGEEPLSFTGWFHAWDPKLWDTDFETRMKNLIKVK